METISDKDEDVLTYLLFPQVALKFFEYMRKRASEDIPQILPGDEVSQNMIVPYAEIVPRRVPEVKKTPNIRGDEEMNLEEIRELIMLLDRSTISELELQKDDFRISLRKAAKQITVPESNHIKSNVISSPTLEDTTPPPIDENIVSVNAPMVGTFYGSPSPEAEPYVKIGQHISKGQTLCILEAMKLMNEIKSEFDGTIMNIAVGNAEAIEYDQVLFLIKKD